MDGSAAAAGLCVAGAAVAAGIYILWGPDVFLRRKGHCAGLENLGNTCFMNAVLQALASVQPVPEWLKAVQGGRLTAALLHTLQSLREGTDGVVSPAPVLHALAWHSWALDYQQQDAHELYHVFLTTLAEETVRCPSLLAALPDPLQEPYSRRSVAYTRAGAVPTVARPEPCPLQGLLTSELVCFSCQYSSPVMCEQFDSLSLTLPLHQPQCSLHSCLLDFIKSEVVPDVECSKCSQAAGCRVKRTFMKRLQLARAPPSLCLHLKRTVWLPSGYLHKSTVPVSFPSQLDLTSLTKTPTPQGQSYELVAVIEHLGGPFSGHYITYRRLQGTQWVFTSDRAVYSCSLQEALSATPYMLFYCRVQSSQ